MQGDSGKNQDTSTNDETCNVKQNRKYYTPPAKRWSRNDKRTNTEKAKGMFRTFKNVLGKRSFNCCLFVELVADCLKSPTPSLQHLQVLYTKRIRHKVWYKRVKN